MANEKKGLVDITTGIEVADADARYAVKSGLAGGQQLSGGTGSGENLTLDSTTHGTKGKVKIGGGTLNVDETLKNIGINTEITTITIGGVLLETTLKAVPSSPVEWITYCSEIYSNIPFVYPLLVGARGRGTSGTPVIVQSGDVLASWVGAGYDGIDFAIGASISMEVDGTPGAGDMPGRVIIATSPDGSETPAERMRIDENVALTGYFNQAGIFAEIYVADASASQSIAAGVTYTKSTAFTTNGESSNCTADATNDKITITQTGRYHVSGSFSGTSGTANITWRGAAFLNGVEQNQVHWKRKMTTTTDSGDMSFTGFVDVTSAPLDLDFRLRHDSGTAKSITTEYANLNVKYMGAT